ncbi:MAG: flavodoxin domain-containing protein [Anaerolineae bacterium]|nr:flavodoxin domain-containing protein [Anaerolineae bacterium]
MVSILVAYASKHDATAEIARAIGGALQESEGINADVRAVETVQDLTGYDAVVLGSAIYVGQWQSAAANFLKEHEQVLAQRPVWLFSSGPTGDSDPVTLLKSWEFPERLKPVVERIQPRDIALFHGRLDPAKLSLFERIVVKGVRAHLADSRDWNMIRAWAQGIAEAL